MTAFLLKTKLYIPPVRPERVPRPRLTRRLDEGLRLGCNLTLISAPAGFGKTMLLSEWLAHRMSAWREDGLAVTSEHETTTLTGDVADQAALRGILGQIWDLNLRVVSVTSIDHETGARQNE